MQWRGAATNRLADVIQSIQLVRKNGVLKIERGGEAGVLLETGTITFVDGQIVDARLNQLSGPIALNMFLAWSSCRFTFLPPSASGSGPVPNPPFAPGYSAPRSSPAGSGPSAPYRIREVDKVLPYFESLGLTRMHRRLFLLIDGQRTATELAHLLGQQANEVFTLLSDLKRAELIKA